MDSSTSNLRLGSTVTWSPRSTIRPSRGCQSRSGCVRPSSASRASMIWFSRDSTSFAWGRPRTRSALALVRQRALLSRIPPRVPDACIRPSRSRPSCESRSSRSGHLSDGRCPKMSLSPLGLLYHWSLTPARPDGLLVDCVRRASRRSRPGFCAPVSCKTWESCRSHGAVHGDGQGFADVPHPLIAQASEAFDEHTERDTLDRVEVDRRQCRYGVQYDFADEAADRRRARCDRTRR